MQRHDQFLILHLNNPYMIVVLYKKKLCNSPDWKDSMETLADKHLVTHLETNRLHLRPFTERDAPDVYEYASDEQTVKYLTWRAHQSVQHSQTVITTFLSSEGTYAIVLKETAKVIGCIDLRIVSETEASFGYVLNRKYWNKGYMSEALQSLVSYVFTELDIVSVKSCHEKENPASGAVMKKCGMQWTHLAKGETLFGKTTDNDHYCITKDAWKKSNTHQEQ